MVIQASCPNQSQQSMSYAEILTGHKKVEVVRHQPQTSTHKNTTAQAPASAQIDDTEFELADLKHPVLLQGTPAILFDVAEKSTLASKYKHTLIGKFSHGKPAWKKVLEFFDRIKLKSSCKVSIYDHKHLFIVCSHKSDFNRLWLRLVWFIDGYAMRVFKWEPKFNVLKESSIAPVWIRMEGLPLYMFDKMPLLNISNAIGKPICIDPRNLNGTVLNSAKVCIELDVSKPLIDSIKVGIVHNESNVLAEEILVRVYYDVVPLFCHSCWHLGHSQSMCKRSIASSVMADFTGGPTQRSGKELAKFQAPLAAPSSSNQVDAEKGDIPSNKTQEWKVMGRKKTINTKIWTVKNGTAMVKGTDMMQTPTEQGGIQEVLVQNKLQTSVQEDISSDSLKTVEDQSHLAAMDLINDTPPAGEKNIELQVNKTEKQGQPTQSKKPKQVANSKADDMIDTCVSAIRDKDGEQFEVEGETLHEVGSHSDVASTDVNAYECCETIITQLDIDSRKNDAASKAIVIVAESLWTDGIEDCNKTKGATSNRVEATKFQQNSQKPTAVSEEAYLQHNRPELNSEVIPFSPPRELIEKGQSFKIATDCAADVDYKNNKTIGVVTRSQMKASNYTWANQVEEEQTAEQHTPIASKKKEEYKARQSSKTRRKEIIKLSNRINKITSRLKDKNLRDETKRQLQADLEALKDEHYRLC